MDDSKAKGKKPKRKERLVLIIDDHPTWRYGLISVVQSIPGVEVCGSAESAAKGLAAVKNEKPDFVLLDLSVPGLNGFELIRRLKAKRPNLRILAISSDQDDRHGVRALQAGALGYMTKRESLERVREAISKVLDNQIYVTDSVADYLLRRAVHSSAIAADSSEEVLSERELEVLEKLGRGHSIASIASLLDRSVRAVESDEARIKDKLGVKESGDLARFARRWARRRKD